MESKGTPFSHLQFMAHSVSPPQIVIMLGKGTRPRAGGPNLNVPFPHLKFCTLTTGCMSLIHGYIVIVIIIIIIIITLVTFVMLYIRCMIVV